MKRLIVPALAMGLAIALATPARADGLLGWCRDKCDPCKPKCETPCKPRCEPCCKLSLPKINLCKPACEKPCKPACPKPCDPCDPCGGHLSKIKGWFHGHGCNNGCNPCGSAPAEAGHEGGHSAFNTTPAPRLDPVPSNTTVRNTTRSSSF